MKINSPTGCRSLLKTAALNLNHFVPAIAERATAKTVMIGKGNEFRQEMNR